MASKVRAKTVYGTGNRGRREAIKGRRPLTSSVTPQEESRAVWQLRERKPIQKPRSDL